MANETEKYNVGFPCNQFDYDFSDQVHLFYKKLDYQQFYGNCDKALGLYLDQMKEGQELLNNYFNAKKGDINK